MKRDMELCRKILFTIEDQYVDSDIIDLQVEGYSAVQIAFHCDFLEKAGLIKDFHAEYADDELDFFSVGTLTWEGYDFLDKVRTDTVWNKIKEVIVKKGLPMALETITQVATAVLSSMTEGAIRALIS